MVRMAPVGAVVELGEDGGRDADFSGSVLAGRGAAEVEMMGG